MAQKSLLDHILLSMIPFTDENLTLAINPRKFFWEAEKIQWETSKKVILTTIGRAKRNGFLKEIEADNEQRLLQITPRGKSKVLKYLDKQDKMTWDGKWRIIMFDIPEKDRKKRDVLRRKLKEIGFKRYQLSVWVCPFDYTKDLEYIISELDLEEHIRYFIGESIKGVNELKKGFNLN